MKQTDNETKTCKDCVLREGNRCSRWEQNRLELPQQACSCHQVKSAVIGVRKIKEHKFITW